MNRKAGAEKASRAPGIIEEAVHLLRRSAGRLLTPYYAGSLPFVLGFLYFWADMSRGANAWQHSVGEAFFVSALFIWMKCWHTVFARRIREQLIGEPARRWTIRSVLRLVTLQTAIQSTGLVLLPIALIITLPFGWLYAFYQNITVFGDGETGGVRAISGKARVNAALFPAQNHAALAVLSLFGFFVFLNLAMVLAILPQLLHMLFGVETVFTRAGGSVFNTTFLAVTCGLSYLTVDPRWAVCALRCFYGSRSRPRRPQREPRFRQRRRSRSGPRLPSLSVRADPGAHLPNSCSGPRPSFHECLRDRPLHQQGHHQAQYLVACQEKHALEKRGRWPFIDGH
jgi:hypothetical protein